MGIAALGPEGVERHVIGWATRMVGGPFDSAEGGVAQAEFFRLGLAALEEFHADAPAAIFGQEHAFAEVKIKSAIKLVYKNFGILLRCKIVNIRILLNVLRCQMLH